MKFNGLSNIIFKEGVDYMEFTKDMTVAQVLRANPKTAQVFMSYGMHCLSCPGATGETLEQAAIVHGFSFEELLADLNKVEE